MYASARRRRWHTNCLVIKGFAKFLAILGQDVAKNKFDAVDNIVSRNWVINDRFFYQVSIILPGTLRYLDLPTPFRFYLTLSFTYSHFYEPSRRRRRQYLLLRILVDFSKENKMESCAGRCRFFCSLTT